MAIFKCKMCGGDLNISEGITVAECEYCGTKQTVSKTNDEVISNFFNRANNLRLKCEFDKAEQIYEKILDIDNTECEAHWGIVLCKYGIEYVEDPSTLKRIPTCHRTLYEAVTTDANYLAAVENADAAQKQLYMQEASVIDALQKDILNIVNGEKPFDVFICYKETDENGNRTTDSVIANDIYHQLTQEGFKVFYAAITLEDKLGQEYEPYIFTALNSAKVMLVVGTKPQFFDAVWVRNEWSRYLKVMKNDRNKLLIPCYKDMDAYELPEAFAHLQAQDMGKIGFINDVVRGIKKVVSPNEQPATQAAITPAEPPTNIAPLLERAFMFLEDGEFNRADEFCEQVLNLDPKCAMAYLGKLMAELHVKTKEQLANCKYSFDNNNNYEKILRFGTAAIVQELKGYNEQIKKEKFKIIAPKKTMSSKKILVTTTSIICAVIAFIIILFTVILPTQKKNDILTPTEKFFVNDFAAVLTEADANTIYTAGTALQEATNAQAIVVTVDSLDGKPIADYALEIGNRWGVGTEDKDNGIVILLSVSDREIYIAVGYGLEDALPDSKIGKIIDNYGLSYFSNDNFSAGLVNIYNAVVNEIYVAHSTT